MSRADAARTVSLEPHLSRSALSGKGSGIIGLSSALLSSILMLSSTGSIAALSGDRIEARASIVARDIYRSTINNYGRLWGIEFPKEKKRVALLAEADGLEIQAMLSCRMHRSGSISQCHAEQVLPVTLSKAAVSRFADDFKAVNPIGVVSKITLAFRVPGRRAEGRWQCLPEFCPSWTPPPSPPPPSGG